MIRLYDLNSCEWRVFPSADHVPAGNYRTESGMRWVTPQREECQLPAAKAARNKKR